MRNTAAYLKVWRSKNQEKIKQYRNDPKNLKVHRLLNWSKRGLIHDDVDALYKMYINSTNCEFCNVDFINDNGKQQRCLDHSHESGAFRNIICKSCNVRLPKHT